MSGPGKGIGLGGTIDGHLIGSPPGWVDVKKPPGYSVQPVPEWLGWLKSNLQGLGEIARSIALNDSSKRRQGGIPLPRC